MKIPKALTMGKSGADYGITPEHQREPHRRRRRLSARVTPIEALARPSAAHVPASESSATTETHGIDAKHRGPPYTRIRIVCPARVLSTTPPAVATIRWAGGFVERLRVRTSGFTTWGARGSRVFNCCGFRLSRLGDATYQTRG